MENREKNNRVRGGWKVDGEIVIPSTSTKDKRQRQIARQMKRRSVLAFLYVVSPEASTLLWPIFFSWAGPTPNGDGICRSERKGKCKCIHDIGTALVYIVPSEVIWN